jgi:hypothetical protein
MFAIDDATGNWKLSGLKVDYFDVARVETDVIAHDAYGIGLVLPLSTIPVGLVFNHTPRGPWNTAMLGAAGVNLNVNLYPDGTGVVGEGSYYPDVDIGTDADGNPDCVTTGQVFPITDAFSWETGTGEPLIFPYANILGLPSANDRKGTLSYGLGINGSSVFDNWGSAPINHAVPSALPYGIYLADGTVLSAPPSQGGVMAGEWGGYFRRGDDLGVSQMGEPNNPSFILEWSAIDSYESGSGFGEDPTVDEDGDGTDFDRIFGIPYVTSTYVNSTNPLCDITGGALTGAGNGLTYPVAGDIVAELGGAGAVGALITGLCLESVAGGAEEACYGQVLDGVYPGCLASVSAGVYDGCLAGVEAGAAGQCEAAGGVTNTFYYGCVEQAYGDDFAAGCAYYGVTIAVAGACEAAGGPATVEESIALGLGGMTCTDIGASYDAACGGDCACASGAAATSCEDSNGTSLCCLAGGIGAATYADCDAFAAGLSDEYLDAAAAGDPSTGYQTCTELSGALAYGLSMGDATAIATLDAMAAGSPATGYMTCTDLSAALAYGYSLGDPTTLATLNGMAAGVVGMGCPDFGAYLQGGLAGGDAGIIATIDGLFAGLTGITCSQYGAAYTVPADQGGLGCIEAVEGALTFYVMEPSLTTWGMFVTYNALSVMQYQAAGYDLATIVANFPELFVNDAAYDFDPSCYATGEPCGGRVLWDFAPTCVPEIEAHSIVAEFVDLDVLECDGTGDVAGGYLDINNNGCADCDGYNGTDFYSCPEYSADGTSGLDCYEGPAGDGSLNVVDIVKLVGHILGQTPLGGYLLCEADISGDGTVNIVDVVAVVNIVLGTAKNINVEDDATHANVTIKGNELIVEGSNGIVQGAQLVLTHGPDFNIVLEDKFVAEYKTIGNTTTIIVVSDATSDLGTIAKTSGDYIVESYLVVNTRGEEVTVDYGFDVVDFELKAAYPNPFNPTTTLEMVLPEAGYVSIKIYNLIGQEVATLANGYMQANTAGHKFQWNASNMASGVYFVRAEGAGSTSTQKLMLLK